MAFEDVISRIFKENFSPWALAWNVLLLASMVSTNMLALYSLSVSKEIEHQAVLRSGSGAPNDLLTSVLDDLASIREELRQTQHQFLSHGEQMQSSSQKVDESVPASLQGFSGSSSDELEEYTTPRKLPLGRNPTSGLEDIVSPIGHSCYQHRDLLEKYMKYRVGELCPDDWDLAQALMIRGCEPLPRRRCFALTPRNYSSPSPYPQSLWSTPPDDTVRWTHYSCKSFDCLSNRYKDSKKFYDCADCFDLKGREGSRWISPRDSLDFMSMKEVLAFKDGKIRIGLDIGGGSGSFAARMREFNVTIITTTINLSGPFNEFVALRGLPALFITVSQRLPFFDNTLDLVHTMHVLSNWIPKDALHFILYDIDRVIRPGGLFWLDHFFCTEDQLDSTFVPLIESLGYKKIRWVVAHKLDPNGIKNKEIYLSALLEKPLRQE